MKVLLPQESAYLLQHYKNGLNCQEMTGNLHLVTGINKHKR
jgi:hypothetical protein